MTSKNKRKVFSNEISSNKEADLFSEQVLDVGTNDDDSSDSEESAYSGLEEEEADSDEESLEDFEISSDSDDDVSEEDGSDGDVSDDGSLSEGEMSLKSDPDEEILRAQSGDSQQINRENEKKVSKLKKRKSTPAKSTSAKSKPGKSTSAKSTPGKSTPEETGSQDKTENTERETGEEKKDEYEVDSSDEEDIRNTVGNIPMEWYREFDHLGYDLDGKKIGKPLSNDQLDEYLDKMDNPNYWRTVNNRLTGQKVVLSDADVDVISRLKQGRYVAPGEDPYQPWVDFFTNQVMQHPLTNRPETKESFLPSKYERQKVGKLVHAIKMGWIKPRLEVTQEERDKQLERKYYLLWGKDDQSELTKRQRDYVHAPKMSLPGHEESYNPPPEYLFTEEEELAWRAKEPYERRVKVIPRKYSSLRAVPAYDKFMRDRFERCLDLYLCPRRRVVRMNLTPEDLIPKLPKPRDLMPFPTVQSLKYEGHEGYVRAMSVCPSGQWLVSGSDDGCVKIWEVQTARCMKTFRVGGVIRSLAWNPNPALSLVAFVKDSDVIVINPGVGDHLVTSSTDEMMRSSEQTTQADDMEETKVPITWSAHGGSAEAEGYRVTVSHPKTVSQVTWHGRGDYFAVTIKDGGAASVFIHQLSKRRSQNPFRKPKGLVQCVLFHPLRPFLFVATQRYVRVYNLLKQELTKKLMTNVKWVSSMAVHPGGDHVIVGSYDCRLSWFDLDLSSKPFKTLRHHRKAVRHVAYHRHYPLFASASDDGTVIVCHGQVYNDLLKNPLIVPVKILRGHQISNDLGVLCCEFHPTQPWLFTSGADSTVRLFT